MHSLRPFIALLVASVVVCLTSCGAERRPLASKAQTWAELRVVRQGVSVQAPGDSKRAPFPRERLVDGHTVLLEHGALAWLRRDGGASLLIGGPAQVEMGAEGASLSHGRVFIDTPAGTSAQLKTPRGDLHLDGVRASITGDPDGTVRIYVLSGRVLVDSGAAAGPGQELQLAKDQTKVVPVTVWKDWTGGLATTDKSAAPAPFGVGTVGARLPGEEGKARWPLVIQRLDVHVEIEADLAITRVEQIFFNPTSTTVEGLYRFRTPPGAALHRFGVDRDGMMVWGYVKEQKQAAAQYQSHVYAGSTEDPALLEWDAPGVYRAKLYPIPPGGVRRVVTRYAEWLPRTGADANRRLYVYPMAAEGAEASLPRVEELIVTIDLSRAGARDVRVGMQGVREGNTLVVRGHDMVPRADLAVELFDEGLKGVRAYRASHVPDFAVLPPEERDAAKKAARDEADYVLVPLRPTQANPLPTGLDLAIVVDASAATDPGAMAIARAATDALLAHLGTHDRVALWVGDVSLRPVGAPGMIAVDEAKRRALSAALAAVERGGATDLGAMLSTAAASLDPARAGAVVYIGDGRPTVGELSLPELRARLERLPRPVRIFTLGVGDDANMALLAGVAHGAFSERVADAFSAARAALRLLEEAERPVWLGTSVSLGTEVERIYPRQLGTLPADQSVMVVGRIKGSPPKSITITGPAGSETMAVQTTAIADQADLMRRWAEGRLLELLDEGAGRAAVVEVGMRYGIITPFTSLYVPTTAEARRQNLMDSVDGDDQQESNEKARRKSDRWKLPWARDDDSAEAEETVADNKEGGTGTRAKGEEGSMGNPTAAARPAPAYAVPADEPMEAEKRGDDSRHWAQGGSKDTGAEPAPKPAGRGARRAPAKKSAEVGLDDLPSTPPATATAAPEAPPPPMGDAFGLGGLGVIGSGPGGGGSGVGLGSAGKLGFMDAEEKSKKSEAAKDSAGADATIALPHAKSGMSRGEIGRTRILCSPAALIPLPDRIKLWRERLTAASRHPLLVVNVYRVALASCEAPSWRERSQLLSIMVDVMGSVPARVSLWRMFATERGTGDAIYGMILTRIRSAAELRQLHDALGIRTIDAATLRKVLADAETPEQRAKKLREFAALWPDDTSLHIQLLNALEDAGDIAGAKDVARQLRRRPDVDASVRTAVGELYFRIGERNNSDADRLEAMRTLGEIVEFADDDPVARRRLGDLMRAHGFHAEAARQYETLAKLRPDEASVPLLRAAAAQGSGKIEEAVRWAEQAAGANAPGGSSGATSTARAFALTALAWARDAALKAGNTQDAAKLRARSKRLLALEQPSPGVRVSLIWIHPDFHPVLWTNALGAMMPATEGDPLLGIAQARLPSGGGLIEVRMEPDEALIAARYGAQAILTVVFDEAEESERIVHLPVRFELSGPNTLRFSVTAGAVSKEAAR